MLVEVSFYIKEFAAKRNFTENMRKHIVYDAIMIIYFMKGISGINDTNNNYKIKTF